MTAPASSVTDGIAPADLVTLGFHSCGAKYSYEVQPNGTVADVCRRCRVVRIVPRRVPSPTELDVMLSTCQGPGFARQRRGGSHTINWSRDDAQAQARALALLVGHAPTRREWKDAGLRPAADTLADNYGGWPAFMQASGVPWDRQGARSHCGA